jgi:hypothetical protein
LPPELDTPEFREAWDAWAKSRREAGKAHTPNTVKLALRKLARFPIEVAVAAVWAAAEGGWQGIFPEKIAPPKPNPPPSPTVNGASTAFDEAKRVILAAPVQDTERYRKALLGLPPRTQAAIKAMGGSRMIRDMTDQNSGKVFFAFKAAYEQAPASAPSGPGHSAVRPGESGGGDRKPAGQASGVGG